MSKVLTEEELLEIIADTVRNGRSALTDEYDGYGHFIEDLAKLIAYHGGADVVNMSEPDDMEGWCAHFAANECTPEDGGVFKFFDNDAPVSEWINETLED